MDFLPPDFVDDHINRMGFVQDVEMETRSAAVDQTAALADHKLDAGLKCFGFVVLDRFKNPFDLGGNRAAAISAKVHHAGIVGDKKDAGDNAGLDAEFA